VPAAKPAIAEKRRGYGMVGVIRIAAVLEVAVERGVGHYGWMWGAPPQRCPWRLLRCWSRVEHGFPRTCRSSVL
jgi:hypothetical protein